MSDCCTPTGSELTPIEEARDYLLSKVSPVTEIERVACEAALGRVLAEPQSAAVDVPPWDNSAMDGYAINTADLNASGETRLRVAQRIPAGVAGKPVAPGTAARIFTGAPMPQGADAVVIQERCERDGDWVSFTGEVEGGANVRSAGEDLRQGEQVLTSGMRLHAQHLGLLASVGIGGSYLCIYGMEGPGGYQFVGRTLQMWNRWRKTAEFEQPWLLRFFDQIRFFPVSEAELLEIREDFPHGRYPLRIEPTTFKLADYNRFLADNQADIAAFKARQQAAFEAERERWIATGQAAFEHLETDPIGRRFAR